MARCLLGGPDILHTRLPGNFEPRRAASSVRHTDRPPCSEYAPNLLSDSRHAPRCTGPSASTARTAPNGATTASSSTRHGCLTKSACCPRPILSFLGDFQQLPPVANDQEDSRNSPLWRAHVACHNLGAQSFRTGDRELLRCQRLIRYAAPDAQVLENFLAPLRIGLGARGLATTVGRAARF